MAQTSQNESDIQRLSAWFDTAIDLDIEQRREYVAARIAEEPRLGKKLAALLQRDARNADTGTQSPMLEALGRVDPADDSRPRPELRLGDYRLIEEVGEGGMGRVWRALREKGDIKQEVAIKLVRRELLHPALLKRFSTERAILAALDHPGIARLIDADTTDDGTPYVAMEYVRGQNIDVWCTRQRANMMQRLQLFRQILAAVAYAHASLVIHRDIKPANVLVSDAGQVKLLDFGIAKHLEANSTHTTTADRYFTPRSAAPEQLGTNPVGVACDVYALGLLLYELLCGRPPFDFSAMTPAEVERTISSVPPPSMHRRAQNDPTHSRSADCPPLRSLQGDIEHVVQRCLRKQPADRYANVAALDADIVNVMQGRPISMRLNERWYRVRKFMSRNRLAMASAGLLMLTVSLAVVAVTRQWLISAAERDRAQSAIALLKNAFAAANPTQISGANVSALQVLDAAKPALDERFVTQPDVYADLAATLVEVEISLGRSHDAAQLAMRAVDAAERAGLDDLSRNELTILHARALTNSGDYERAEAELQKASASGAEGEIAWQLAKGRLAYLTGGFDVAVAVLKQALIATQDRDARDEQATAARLQLSQALRMDGDSAAALKLLDDTLRWQTSLLDARHPRVLLTRMQRLIVLRNELGAEAALPEARSVLAAVLDVFGSNSTVAASAYSDLGSILNSAGDGMIAADAFRSALSAWRASVGDNHPNTLRTAFNLAQMLGEFPAHRAEAEALMREAIMRGPTALGPNQKPVLLWRVSLAELVLNDGRAQDALSMLDELVSSGARGEMNPDLGRYFDDLMTKARAAK